MSEASFASLNPALLARKGGAKPAMRPQLAPLDPAKVAAMADEALEDLGWNDIDGEEASEGAKVVPIGPLAANEDAAGGESPVVRRQQKDLADRVLADAAMPASDDGKPGKAKSSSAAKGGRRAAFTLRLDTDRHLKLRLASTMRGISAQALVTEALDALLEDFDDLDALAERMKRN